MTDQTNPADAIVAHHAEMVREHQCRTDQLIATVARGAPSEGAASAVADYCATTIFAHALAEEKTLLRCRRTRRAQADRDLDVGARLAAAARL